MLEVYCVPILKGSAMSSHAVWKGTINFGLVSIPIELYSAIQPHAIGFKMLHKKCNTPISNKRWCAHCDSEIAWEEIVKGLKLPDGSYFVITKENLEKLKPEKTDTIDVMEFVDTKEIPTVYFDQHYYVIPQKSTDKAFFLLTRALKERKQSAIGQFVLRDKEHMCFIQPYKTALLMTTLNYDYEVKELDLLDQLKVPSKPDKEELKLAELLIDKLYKQTFDMSQFKDTFASRLAKAIKLKQDGKVIKVEKKPKATTDASLMDALRLSLKKFEKPTPANKPSMKKRQTPN